MPLTPRLGIPTPLEIDPPDGPVQMGAMAVSLDDAAIDLQGLLADRPAANTVPSGTWYWATDTNSPTRSDGAAWYPVGQAGLAIGDLKASYQVGDHPGWLFADGRNNIPRADHPGDFVALMLARGFAGVDGITFGVPNHVDRTIVGAGVKPLGTAGGEETHLLTGAESGTNANGRTGFAGTHHHSVHYEYGAAAPNWFGLAYREEGGRQFDTNINTSDDGNHDHPLVARAADAAHNNLQPYRAANIFIYTGAPGPGGAGPTVGGAREEIDIVTANLAAGAGESGLTNLGSAYRAMRVEADRPCRVRLYTTPAQRTADAARLRTVDPQDFPAPGATPNHGLVLEVVLAAANLVGGVYVQDLAPNVVGSSNEAVPADAIAYRVENDDAVARVITVTLTVQPLE